MKRILIVAVLMAMGLALVVGGSRLVIVRSAFGRIDRSAVAGADSGSEYNSDEYRVDEYNVAVVFGAKVRVGDVPSDALKFRVENAVELYNSGRVTHLLMTGDNSRKGYDEPTIMRRQAIQAGVPASAITLDYAGFDTWDSCARAVKIFGVKKAVLVTQSFHMDRAIFLCRRAGLDSIGYPVPDDRLPDWIISRLRLREWLASPKAVWEGLTNDDPTYLGEFVGLIGSESPANPDPVVDDTTEPTGASGTSGA